MGCERYRGGGGCQGRGRCWLLWQALDDVEAELGFDDVADLAGLEGEESLLEGEGEQAAALSADVAAAIGGGVFGVLARELGEVGAGLELLQELVGEGFGLLARARDGRIAALAAF